MKKLKVVALIALLFICCKKENNITYQSQGVLLGPDLGMCPICGGMKVKILTNDTVKNPPGYYRSNANFSALGFKLTATYPVNVQLNWTINLPEGGGYYITITKIAPAN